MYSVPAYSRMIADQPRMAAYVEALRRSVRAGSVVVDLGAGTGVMTLLACRFGARRVYAIEPDDVIQVAREVVRENGCADRVEFFQQISTRVELPERADVIVSDLRGVLPFFGQHLPALRDARTRLLAPGGVLIPQCDTLWAAPVEAPEIYSTHVAAASPDGCNFQFTSALRHTSNTWRRVRVGPRQLLAEPQCWGTLNYGTFESPDMAGELRWSVSRTGTAHGIVVWFDTLLADGAGFSNAPASPELIYGNGFFPLSEALALAAGDTVTVALRADLVDADYVWRWDTRASTGAEFSQSSFYAAPLGLEQMRKQAASHVPTLNEDGEIDLFILQRLEEGKPLGEVAGQVAERFPSRFASAHEALTRVGELSLRYSR